MTDVVLSAPAQLADINPTHLALFLAETAKDGSLYTSVLTAISADKRNTLKPWLECLLQKHTASLDDQESAPIACRAIANCCADNGPQFVIFALINLRQKRTAK